MIVLNASQIKGVKELLEQFAPKTITVIHANEIEDIKRNLVDAEVVFGEPKLLGSLLQTEYPKLKYLID